MRERRWYLLELVVNHCPPPRHVRCTLEFVVEEPTVLALQIAAFAGGDSGDERFEATLGGVPLEEPAVDVVAGANGRSHLVRAGCGLLRVEYGATVLGGAAALAPSAEPARVFDEDAIVSLRQSRYCPSDVLAGFAEREFPDAEPTAETAAEVARWVFERLAYEPGSSGPTDTAIETLTGNVGVCRDFAHLTIALCRGLGIPARLVAVYAPGLSPMDFHAVVEVRAGTGWEVLDPTRMAPRQTLVRIATGRDAADTAFATTLSGAVELTGAEIGAVVEGDLPLDDHATRIRLD